MTASALIDAYQNAYRAFFAEEPPPVRKLESGSFSIRFPDGSKRYRKTELVAVTAMMRDMKGSADA